MVTQAVNIMHNTISAMSKTKLPQTWVQQANNIDKLSKWNHDWLCTRQGQFTAMAQRYKIHKLSHSLTPTLPKDTFQTYFVS